jgi:hypothetical protein
MLLKRGTIKLLIGLLLLVQLQPGHTSEKERYLHACFPGIRHDAERDRAYSPLIYSGIQGSFSVAISSESLALSDNFAINYSTGKIHNSYGSAMQVHTAGIQTYKFYHRDKDRQEGLHWGWSNNNEFNTRSVEDINFNNRSEYFTSFGPAARYRLPFTLLNRQFHFETLTHLQLVGFTLQSSYVTSLPPGFEEPSNKGISAFLNSIDIFYPGNSWNFGIQPTMRYRLKSGNMLSIGYKYDYLRLRGAHITEKSRGSWYFGIITAL